MRNLKDTIVLCILFFFFGCLKKDKPAETVVDFSGKTVYYIANDSELGLNVTYQIQIAPTPVFKDSTVTLPANTTTEIFELGGLGGHFPPSTAFVNLTFYRGSGDNKDEPLLTIEPIDDDRWKSVPSTSENEIGYVLTITSEDID